MGNLNRELSPEIRSSTYDIEIVVPVHAGGKYGERINSFRQYGLLNLTRRRVRLVLLTGRSDMSSHVAGWPCDTVAIPGVGDSMSAKVHAFYSSLSAGQTRHARWFARVDDDSCTDVGALIDRLDADYDFTDPNYIIADVCRDLDPNYQQILRDMGAGGLLAPNEGGKGLTIHEWEGCVLSQAALRRIVTHPLAKEFLRRCAHIDDGWADHPLAIAAQLARIHPSDCWFMTAQASIDNFSLLGGNFVHIHYVAPDKPEWPELRSRLQDAGVPSGRADVSLVSAESLTVQERLHRARKIRTLFLTISDGFFYPGTVATVNAVRHFHPNADVVVVNSNISCAGLSPDQRLVLTQAGVRVMGAESFARSGRSLDAWSLKAYAAQDLTDGYDVLVGIDSDCVLCGPVSDVVVSSCKSGKFNGGNDGSVCYGEEYRQYGIDPPVMNDQYMSASLYVCALTEENRAVLSRWADCCADAAFHGGRYPGHGDQGVLNAVLFQQRGSGGVELLDNHLWSQHWCYWEDELRAEDGVLINSALETPQRAIHCGGPDKFWTQTHSEKLALHSNHRVNYAWFLSFLWFGQCCGWDRAAAPEDSARLRHDLWQLRQEVAGVNPELILSPKLILPPREFRIEEEEE